MLSRIWRPIIEAAPDPRRCGHFLDRLVETPAAAFLQRASKEQARILTELLSGSNASAELLLANPEWVELADPEALSHPRQAQGFRRDTAALVARHGGLESSGEALDALRRLKQREIVRIAMRDLSRLGQMEEVTRELSDLADACLARVVEICMNKVSARLGLPYHERETDHWERTRFVVIGLGKLGGQELNFSSDIDVIFVYDDEGWVVKTPPTRGFTPGKGMNNHQFFRRVAESIIAEVRAVSTSGTLYRIDLRLRPEGGAGPLTRSLESYENYYAQAGQTWERLMLGKARPVAGDLGLGAEFLETIQTFRYPRMVGERMLRDVAAVKRRTESEVVKPGELERNVKLGRGGIREIEFITQSLQLLHAGRQPFLQEPQTLPALRKLARYNLLSNADAIELTEAYQFLRDLEHRLQMENYQQTHTVPTERHARERLARLMGFPRLEEFESSWRNHAERVRRRYGLIFKLEGSGSGGQLPPDFQDAERWIEILRARGFRSPQEAQKRMQTLIEGPGYVHVSPRTSELALELAAWLLERCPGGRSDLPPTERLSDPDRVLVRLEAYVAAYGARATLYEEWVANRSLFKLLVLLFDRSEYLAEAAIATPDLLDEIESTGRLQRAKSPREHLEELQHGKDGEDRAGWVRKYQQAEMMRIGLRDILELATFEQGLKELTSLAEACLEFALETVLGDRLAREVEMAIIGLGKLGGTEINYGSDLDVMFVVQSAEKHLPQCQKVVAELIELLDSRSRGAPLLSVDVRLRPDGEKGMLANTMEAYRAYYQNRAMLWEIQSLTRARVVAGHRELGESFLRMAQPLADFRKPAVSCYTKNWKSEIRSMRQRIEKERTPAGMSRLALKTGPGGLMDAEFVAQAYCLETGRAEPNTMKALRAAAEMGWLSPVSASNMIDHYARLHRTEAILRRWSFQGETILPADEAAQSRVALRCGYERAEEFLDAVTEWRARIRNVYDEVFA